MSTNAKEALSGDIEYHFGDLFLAGNEMEAAIWNRELVPVGVKLPKVVSGKMSIMGMSLKLKLTLPERVENITIAFSDTDSASGLALPKYVGQELNLQGLKTTDGLIFPAFMGKKPHIFLEE